MKRTVLYISGTRADYGLMKPVLAQLANDEDFNLEVIATGMHMMPEFGLTVQEIEKDGFKCHKIPVTYEDNTRKAMAVFLAKFLQAFIDSVSTIQPNFILLLGDRAEMLAGAVTGAYLGIPVAHIHGGENSSTVDDPVRHAITKLSNIHFPATTQSAERIIRMGEKPEFVFVAGAPGLEQIREGRLVEPEKIASEFGLDLRVPILLVLYHPVTLEENAAGEQMSMILNAISELKFQTIIVYPNADAGSRDVIGKINEFSNRPFIKIFRNIDHTQFLSLLRISSVLIGNSSSGIIEAASFGLPVVNIGSRQRGRERGPNVIDAGYNGREILKAIQFSLYDRKFIDSLKSCKNPYDNGKTAEIITGTLRTITINRTLLEKKMTY
jgi:UDP-hydrolysing UDP-N-acetyl-D-glucosamine 2-epimerase